MKTGLVAVVAGFALMVCCPRGNACEDPMAGVAIDIGLTPRALAAAGINTGQATTMLFNLDQAASARAELAQAKTAAEEARVQLEACVAQLQADPSNAELRELRATRRTSLRTAAELVGTRKVALRQLALEGVSAQAQARVSQFIARSGRRVPDHFRLAQVAESRWPAIEQALIRRDRSVRTETTLATTHAEVLAVVDADSEVVAASVNLTSLLAALEQLFQQPH